LLRVALREFDAETKTLDESLLHAQWPALRDRLAATMRDWDAVPAGVPLGIPLTTHTTIIQHAAPPPTRRPAFLRPTRSLKPANPSIPQSAPAAPSWKARIAARAARLAQSQRSSNLWSQL
jgi:hypothetical protein